MDFPLPRCWPRIERKWASGEEEGLWVLFHLPLKWTRVALDGRQRNEEDRSPDFLWSPEGLEAGTGHPCHADSMAAFNQGKVHWQQLDEPPASLASPSPLPLLCLPVSIWTAEMNSGWVRWSRNPSFIPHLVPSKPSLRFLACGF